MHTEYWLENPREHTGDTRKLEDNNWDLQRLVCKGVEWIYLANDKVNWKALVKRVIKLRPA